MNLPGITKERGTEGHLWFWGDGLEAHEQSSVRLTAGGEHCHMVLSNLLWQQEDTEMQNTARSHEV